MTTQHPEKPEPTIRWSGPRASKLEAVFESLPCDRNCFAVAVDGEYRTVPHAHRYELVTDVRESTVTLGPLIGGDYRVAGCPTEIR